MRTESARKAQAGTVTAVRLDDRLRHLTEIAAATKGMNLTDYIGWALTESFEKVSLHVPTEPEIIYEDFAKPPTVIPPDPDEERAQWEAKLISARADDLWNENKFMRLWAQVILAPHTLNQDRREFFDYITSRKDLWLPAKALPGMKGASKGFQPDRERIDREYEEIWNAFEKQRTTKGEK